jgi:hypothetical protein
MEENVKSTIAYRIEIDKEVWKELKKKTTREMTMNNRVCRLIYKEVGIPYPEEPVDKKASTKSTKSKK